MALEKKISVFPYNIILASASPRRKELLSGLGFKFSVKPVHADETWPNHLRAQQIALYLAELKANAYSEKLGDKELLITSDTIVWCEEKIFNKPKDFEEGKKMLASLSGKMHEVFTAVTLKTNKKQVSFYDASKVYFKPLTDEEIEYYLVNYKPYDKAGGYGVQDWIGYIAIDRIEGSFYNVMGLPVKMVYEELMKFSAG
jgi:septum formation protein